MTEHGNGNFRTALQINVIFRKSGVITSIRNITSNSEVFQDLVMALSGMITSCEQTFLSTKFSVSFSSVCWRLSRELYNSKWLIITFWAQAICTYKSWQDITQILCILLSLCHCWMLFMHWFLIYTAYNFQFLNIFSFSIKLKQTFLLLLNIY